jgi:hypothetical protein
MAENSPQFTESRAPQSKSERSKKQAVTGGKTPVLLRNIQFFFSNTEFLFSFQISGNGE